MLARIVWEVDAARPRPQANRAVFDRAGRHLATPDLIDPDAGVVLEHDGRLHLESARRRDDRDREERYREHGIECVEPSWWINTSTVVKRRALDDRDRELWLRYRQTG